MFNMLALSVRQGVLLHNVVQCAGGSWMSLIASPFSSVASSSSSVTTPNDAATTSSSNVSLDLVQPTNVTQQKQLTIDGRQLTGDPGSSRYTAPYYIPEQLRKGAPRVLYTDPWPVVEDIGLRKHHARLCLEHLRSNEEPLTAQQIYDGINRNSSTGPVFGSTDYVKQLMEHLRVNRIVRGLRNSKELSLSPAHPDHPRRYLAFQYQQSVKGLPSVIQKQSAQQRQEEVARAMRRLRRGKAPYIITRRVAKTSIYQHALAEEAMQNLVAPTPEIQTN